MSQAHRFEVADGVRLAWRELGEGRPVVLLHGFLSSAERNWFAPGVAQALAEAGHRVIAPDCRGHGASDAPEAPGAWPPDVMAADVEALIAHLRLTDYDLAGYSMGGRTAARVLVRGARPRRCVLGGMGDFGIMHAGPRAEAFEDAIRHGEAAADPAMGRALHRAMAAQGLKPAALLGVLAAFAPTTKAELAAIPTPTLAILGEDDHDNGSVEALAAIMPACTPLTLPGDHGAVVATPAFREAMVGFLA
ncbi:alpha/beta fold hydrolase [Caulobacter sp. KR2-114]|uniref:alpha/beta fold hydrolase n=1 Tax=Caulobacter sp. KR2-114 TaxID=3400912 RepID=UPI003C096EA1